MTSNSNFKKTSITTQLTFKRGISLSSAYADGPSLSGLAWAFNMIPTKHTGTSIWHATLIAGVF
jgi:hypothetical protein